MKPSFSGLTSTAAAMAAAFGLSLVGPHRAAAAPTVPVTQNDNNGPVVTILSPVPRTRFSGDSPIEVSAFYQGASTNQIISVDLYVDGMKAATKSLTMPEMRGVVSFLLPASELTAGTHRIVVRATASDAEVTSAKSSFVYMGAQQLPTIDESAPLPINPTPAGSPGQQSTPTDNTPHLSLATPAPGSKVEGTVKVQIQANAVNGKRPYVSLFVDREFKDLRNYPPYEFEWDTTHATNGLHTIEILEAFDDPAQGVAHLKPVSVYVNNPGGLTPIRHDLLDAPKPVKNVVKSASKVAVAAHPKKSALRPLPQRRPIPALLAAATPEHVPLMLPTHLAKSDDLAGFTGDLRMTPGLADPFLPSVTMTVPAAIVKAPAVKVAAPKPVMPTTGFKPLPAKKVRLGAPVMASRLATGNQRVSLAAAHLLRMAQAGLQSDGLSSPFLAAPVVTEYAPRVALAAPHKTVAVHTPSTTATPRLIHSQANNALVFNSKLLRLERPIAARHSVMFGPLRQVFEFGGGSLLWEGRTGTVRLKRQASDMKLTIGKKNAVVNQQNLPLDAAPYLSHGRTMVPVSFLPMALNANVHYDPATGNLLITSKK